MDHGRYQNNHPLHLHAQDFAGELLQQLCKAIENIKSHHKRSCKEEIIKWLDIGIIYPISDSS